MTNQAIATRKNKIMRALEALQPELVHMSDFIFDHPEIGFQEVQAAQLLSGYLQGRGFQLEMGYGGLPTAFRAIHQNGHGGPASASFASTTPSRTSATPAPTTCKARASPGPRWR